MMVHPRLRERVFLFRVNHLMKILQDMGHGRYDWPPEIPRSDWQLIFDFTKETYMLNVRLLVELRKNELGNRPTLVRYK